MTFSCLWAATRRKTSSNLEEVCSLSIFSSLAVQHLDIFTFSSTLHWGQLISSQFSEVFCCILCKRSVHSPWLWAYLFWSCIYCSFPSRLRLVSDITLPLTSLPVQLCWFLRDQFEIWHSLLSLVHLRKKWQWLTIQDQPPVVIQEILLA